MIACIACTLQSTHSCVSPFTLLNKPAERDVMRLFCKYLWVRGRVSCTGIKTSCPKHKRTERVVPMQTQIDGLGGIAGCCFVDIYAFHSSVNDALTALTDKICRFSCLSNRPDGRAVIRFELRSLCRPSDWHAAHHGTILTAR